MRLAHVCGEVSMIDATGEGRCVFRIFLHKFCLWGVQWAAWQALIVESSPFWRAMCRSESAHTAQEIIELAARPGELELFQAQDFRTSAHARSGTR